MKNPKSTFPHKRVAIDFDGTLFEEEATIDETFEKQIELKCKSQAMEVTQWLKEQGFEILIFTCRPDYHRRYLENLLRAHRIAYDYILFYTKPRVDLYIDDKGFRFESWEMTKKWIIEKLASSENLKILCEEPKLPFESVLRKEKIKHLPIKEMKNILDVGCGSGDVFDGVVLEKFKLDGMEPDETLRHEAEQKKIYHEIFSSLSHVSLSSYDCITLLGVLEHVEDDSAFLNQFKSSKRLYITVPNAESFHRRLGVKLGLLENLTELKAHDHEVGHKRYYTYDSFHKIIAAFCTQNGFEIKKMGTTTLKITCNQEMALFADRTEALNFVGEELKLVGVGAQYGAEIFCYLEKKNG